MSFLLSRVAAALVLRDSCRAVHEGNYKGKARAAHANNLGERKQPLDVAVVSLKDVMLTEPRPETQLCDGPVKLQSWQTH